MDVGTLLMKVSADTTEFESKMNKTQAGISKLKVAALAAGVALVKVGVDSIKAFAEYEQLVGGVDTLFKQSSKAVQGYAEIAYKTAGLSANQYMETVTGFSASLLQSLGGDTEKAAKYADRAIIDMSDNANKMGSSMESIQNAYQGFAKQNYTMLDNLKLGYGGTKTEMERLLADASKISGFKFDITSYADVTEAIHIIQEEMGIMGTTQQEAEETITGSVSAMKAAYKNLLVGFADSEADLEALTGNLVKAFGTVLKNVLPVIGNIASALPDAIIMMIGHLWELLPSMVSSVANIFGAILEGVITKILEVIGIGSDAIENQFTPVINDLKALVGEALPAIKDIFAEVFQIIGEVVMTVWTIFTENFLPILLSVFEFIEENFPAMKETFLRVFNAIKSILDVVWQLIQITVIPVLEALFGKMGESDGAASGFQAAFDIINGVLKAAITIIETLVGWIQKAIDKYKALREAMSATDYGGMGGGGGGGWGAGGVPNSFPLPKTKLAEGGIVTKPTVALIGEAGAEAVIPLNKGGYGNNVTINVRSPFDVVKELDYLDKKLAWGL